MLRSFFEAFDTYGQDSERQSGQEGLQRDEQQDRGLQQPQDQDDRFFQGQEAEVLRAIWDNKHSEAAAVAPQDAARTGSSTATQVAQAAQGGGSSTERQQTPRASTSNSDESAEERRERQRLEGTENVAKRKRGEQKLETISDAVSYCRELISMQLERATYQHAPMNMAIYGDAHTRKAVTTLLPDQFIRKLFLETARIMENMPRIRPLFGVPPYNFLRPEDAGLVRASGIASGRTNMAYDKMNETASYNQFGAGHLVDDYFREYRVVAITQPREADDLPCDLEKVGPQKPVYLNVRVPKRSKQERLALLKDASKRKSVIFPAVGEVLTVNYSNGLQAVWGSKANTRLDTKIVVKGVVPRSATGATAALVAFKMS